MTHEPKMYMKAGPITMVEGAATIASLGCTCGWNSNGESWKKEGDWAAHLPSVEHGQELRAALGWCLQHTNGHEPNCNLNQQQRWDEAQDALNSCPEGPDTAHAQAEINVKRNRCTCGYWEGLQKAEDVLNRAALAASSPKPAHAYRHPLACKRCGVIHAAYCPFLTEAELVEEMEKGQIAAAPKPASETAQESMDYSEIPELPEARKRAGKWLKSMKWQPDASLNLMEDALNGAYADGYEHSRAATWKRAMERAEAAFEPTRNHGITKYDWNIVQQKLRALAEQGPRP